MARAAEKIFKLRPRGNSCLVAGLKRIQIKWKKNIKSDLMARGSSDLVAGLKETQI